MLKKTMADAHGAARQRESIHEKQMESANKKKNELHQEVITSRARCDALSIAVAEEKKKAENYEEQTRELAKKRNETKMLLERIEKLQKEMKERKGPDASLTEQDARRLKWHEGAVIKYKENEERLCKEYEKLKKTANDLKEEVKKLESERKEHIQEIKELRSEMGKQCIEADKWLQLGKEYQEKLETLEQNSMERTGYRWFRKDPPLGCDETTKENWTSEDAEEEWICPETDIQWGETEYYDCDEWEGNQDADGEAPEQPAAEENEERDPEPAETTQQAPQEATSHGPSSGSNEPTNQIERLVGALTNAIQSRPKEENKKVEGFDFTLGPIPRNRDEWENWIQALIAQLLANSIHSDEKESRWLTEATDWGKTEEPVKDVAYPYQEDGERNRWLKLDLKFREKLQKSNLPDQVVHRIAEFMRSAPKKDNGSKAIITGRQILIYLMEYFPMAQKEPRYKLMHKLPQLQWRGDTLHQLGQTMWEFPNLYTKVKEWGGPSSPPLSDEEENHSGIRWQK